MTIDWATQCEAIVRGTKTRRCPHRCCCQIPNTLAHHCVMDGNQFSINGRPVHLCRSHQRHFDRRQRRLLSVRLIDGGYLSAYNRHGYGSIVTTSERIDFGGLRLRVPVPWGPQCWTGNVPEYVWRALDLSRFANLATDGRR